MVGVKSFPRSAQHLAQLGFVGSPLEANRQDSIDSLKICSNLTALGQGRGEQASALGLCEVPPALGQGSALFFASGQGSKRIRISQSLVDERSKSRIEILRP